MKLVRVRIKNFRCYSEESEYNFDDLCCLIGKNDMGKSSILEALNAFFNDVIDSGDLCTQNDEDSIEITCLFDEFPEDLVLDSSVDTTLTREHLLNGEGLLELKRVIKVGKTLSKSMYLVCEHPTNPELTDLLSMKNSVLKTHANGLGIDLTGINKSKNPELREAIRNSCEITLGNSELKIDGTVDNESNLKLIWRNLKKYLPIYSLFKVDKNINDKDKDVQDPMKQAIKEALAVDEIQQLLSQVEDAVKAKSTEVADQTLEKLKDIDKAMAEKMKSEFAKFPSWEKIFDLTLLSDTNVPLNKRGSGVKRLVLLSFFQAQAEKRKSKTNAPSIIYAIEEPETAQHPNHQLTLIESLIALSETGSVQVFFTTHSANLVREIPVQSLSFISREGANPVIKYPYDFSKEEIQEEILEEIIQTLGVLPNPDDRIKSLFYVEGNNDINALKRYSKTISVHDNEIVNLEVSVEVAYIITGGSSLKFYVENRYLSGLGKPEIHLYDSDVADYVKAVKKINDEGNPRKKAYNTSKRELENYLVKEAIEEAYQANGLIVVLEEITDDMDVPEMVARCVYDQNNDGNYVDLDYKVKKKKESACKKLLNTQAVERMTIDRINQRGGYEDITNWLIDLNGLCQL